MKFVYEYRTSDNVPHRGTIAASTKEAAYDTLKSRGIKPGKVWEAPGIFNKVFGKGKRWIAIVVLLVALAGVTMILRTVSDRANQANQELEDITLFCERGQIYGAAPVLQEMEQDEYASVFDGDLERYLAPYAVPAKVVGDRTVQLPTGLTLDRIAKPVPVVEDDYDEVKRLKRMVNGMKRELVTYIRDGGRLEGYAKRLDIRQKAEYGIYMRVKRELEGVSDVNEWRRQNNMLRAKGLPMVETFREEEEK